MTTLSLGQAARLTGRGKTILARAISGRFFTGSKEDGGHNMDGAESARVYPFPAPVETVAELRTRLALAEERLTDLKAMLEDMRRDRNAWREQAQTRLLPAPAAPMSWCRLEPHPSKASYCQLRRLRLRTFERRPQVSKKRRATCSPELNAAQISC